MSLSKKINILIPVYNRSAYIKECVDSALSQTYENFDIIVVDNQSTDGTWEILHSLYARNSKVRLYRNESNIGPVQNWKRCIEYADADFSKILFSDDLLLKDCLADMMKVYDEDVALVVSSVLHGADINNSAERYRISKYTKPVSSYRFMRYLIGSFGSLVSPGAALFRTADLKKNFTEEITGLHEKCFSYYGAGPDLLLFLKVCSDYKKVMFISTPLVFFRDHPGSATSLACKTREWPIRESYSFTRAWFSVTIRNSRLLGMALARWVMVLLLYENVAPKFKKFFSSNKVDPITMANALFWFLIYLPLMLMFGFGHFLKR